MLRRILMVFLFLGCISCEKKQEVKEDKETSPVQQQVYKNERPAIKAMLEDGREVNLQTLDEDFLVVLFNPECDHCHDAAKQMKSTLDRFDKYQIYFLSSENLELISQFAKEMALDSEKNVFFGNAPSQMVYDAYGPIPTPSTYIYKKDGRLIQSFEGLVDVEVIVKYL